MQLTEQDLADFRTAYTQAFGEGINENEVREMASRLLRLYELLVTLPCGKPLDQIPPSAIRSGQRSNPI